MVQGLFVFLVYSNIILANEVVLFKKILKINGMR
jgi:hypothetical protein